MAVARSGGEAAPAFPCRAPAYVSPTRHSALAAARLTIGAVEGTIEGSMTPEDAFVALFQLRDHPPHLFRRGGRFEKTAAAPRGGLHIVDLRAAPVCRLSHPVDTLLVHLPRAAIDEIAEDAGAPKVRDLAVPDPWRTRDPVFPQLAGLIAEGIAAGAGGRLLYDHLLVGVAGHLLAAYGGLSPSARRRGGLAPWQRRRAEELLSASLGKELSLAEIAGECELSLAYFARAFKVSTGLSPHAWRQARRVERAKTLLGEEAAPLAEIAVACGFADQSHLNRVFSREVGTTPRAWQRQRHRA